MQVHYFDILNRSDSESAVRAAAKWQADAILLLVSPVLMAHPQDKSIGELFLTYRREVQGTARLEIASISTFVPKTVGALQPTGIGTAKFSLGRRSLLFNKN